MKYTALTLDGNREEVFVNLSNPDNLIDVYQIKDAYYFIIKALKNNQQILEVCLGYDLAIPIIKRLSTKIKNDDILYDVFITRKYLDNDYIKVIKNIKDIVKTMSL